MKIAGSDHIKPGHYVLIRDGAVAMAGPIGGVSDHYQAGDTLVVSVAAFERLSKLSPSPETPHPHAWGRGHGDE